MVKGRKPGYEVYKGGHYEGFTTDLEEAMAHAEDIGGAVFNSLFRTSPIYTPGQEPKKVHRAADTPFNRAHYSEFIGLVFPYGHMPGYTAFEDIVLPKDPLAPVPCQTCGKGMSPLEAIVMGQICESCVRKAHRKVTRR